MPTPESYVKEAVKKLLKRYSVYYHMPVQNGMGKPTLDFVCCHVGYFFAIETKAAGGKPTPRQEVTIAEMRAAGAQVFVVAGDNGLASLETWLRIAPLPLPT